MEACLAISYFKAAKSRLVKQFDPNHKKIATLSLTL